MLGRLRPHLPHRGPEAERAVTDREDGGAHPAALEIPEHRAPALGALPVAVLQGDHFLRPVRPHPDQHERAQPLVLHADREVDAVGPEVDVVAIREIPPVKGLILGGPAFRQPRDGAGRQPGGLRPEQGRQAS